MDSFIHSFPRDESEEDKSASRTLERTLERRAKGEPVNTKQRVYPKTAWAKRVAAVTSYFEKNRLQIFWATLYTLVSIGIFAERAYCKLSFMLNTFSLEVKMLHELINF